MTYCAHWGTILDEPCCDPGGCPESLFVIEFIFVMSVESEVLGCSSSSMVDGVERSILKLGVPEGAWVSDGVRSEPVSVELVVEADH